MERLSYLDYSRVFAAYLVIFGHLLPMDNHMPRDLIYAFHMPFFFMVSGMLHKFNGQIQWKKYLRTIGIPLLFFNVFYFFVVNPLYLLWGVFGDGGVSYSDAIQSGLSNLRDGLLENGNIPSGVTWFLVVLIWCKLLMDVILLYPRLGMITFIVLFCLTMAYKFQPLYFRNAMMVFPFYYVGSTYKNKIKDYAYSRRAVLYAIFSFFLMFCVVLINGRTSTRGVGFGHAPYHLSLILFYISAFLGSMMMLFLSTQFKGNKTITYIATALITILGMQAIFNDPYRTFFPSVHYEIMIPLSLIILLLCTGIHWVIMRFAPYLLGKTRK